MYNLLLSTLYVYFFTSLQSSSAHKKKQQHKEVKIKSTTYENRYRNQIKNYLIFEEPQNLKCGLMVLWRFPKLELFFPYYRNTGKKSMLCKCFYFSGSRKKKIVHAQFK